jgi:opacity protein-like surface antigen
LVFFKHATTIDSAFTAARAYLGLTFQKHQLFDAAAYHFRLALSASLPKDIAEIIKAYLYDYDKKNGFNYYLKGNVSRGTNPNLKFEQDTVKIGDLSFEIDDASQAKPETSLELFANASYNMQATEKVKLQTALNANGKYYKNSKSYQYTIEPSSSMFYQQDADKNYSLSVFTQSKFNTHQKTEQGYGVRAGLQRFLDKNIIYGANLEYKKYDDLVIAERSGEYYSAKSSITHVGAKSTLFRYQLEHRQNQIGIESLSSKTNLFNFTVLKPFRGRVRGSASVELAAQHYNAASGIFGIKRQDSTVRVNLKAHLDKYEFQGLSPYVEASYTNRKSNINEFSNSDRSIFAGIDFAY